MSAFRYQAIEGNGVTVDGVIEAEDRKTALQLLTKRGLFPSSLEVSSNGNAAATPGRVKAEKSQADSPKVAKGGNVRRKKITAFTTEMSALLSAGIPIPQALDGLGEEEENPKLKVVILQISDSVRKGVAFSTALDEHPRLFNKLYVSMVRVGEEAGVLPTVMADLGNLLQHEDEVRGEVAMAAAYPMVVLISGIATVIILMTFVLPKLMGMLNEMMSSLPLPTLILMKVSSTFHRYWVAMLIGTVAVVAGLRWFFARPQGEEMWDRIKLRIPVMGPVFQSAALSRFARTLGTLVKSGVSLLPALKIVEGTIGNIVLAQSIARVAEETRGGDSLATPLRKMGIFPKTVVQMIGVGEETGKLDEMLLRVADIEERHMRTRIKTVLSMLSPALIMVMGGIVGFIVIAILIPVFRMSRAIH